MRVDLIGVTSLFADDDGRWLAGFPDRGATDVRLRIAMNHRDRASAERLAREVNALYTCGPAGGGATQPSSSDRPIGCGVRAATPTR